MDFFSKTITVFKDNTLKLQIWDSAGQERYKSLIPSYVRGASIIFILYDLSSKTNLIEFNNILYHIKQHIEKETFDNVPNWISFIKNVKVENALIVLCGNKLDLERYKKYFLKNHIYLYIFILFLLDKYLLLMLKNLLKKRAFYFLRFVPRQTKIFFKCFIRRL